MVKKEVKQKQKQEVFEDIAEEDESVEELFDGLDSLSDD